MKAIVAVNKCWGIGYEGKLLERIPEDMRFFRQTTFGKVVVMGRNTFESLPGREPLRGRTNIVLSTNKDFNHSGIISCRSLEELSDQIAAYETGDIFVIGGAQVYAELLPFCSEAYVTKFKKNHMADSYFPNLDRDSTWTPIILTETLQYNGLKYNRVKYVNSKIAQFP